MSPLTGRRNTPKHGTGGDDCLWHQQTSLLAAESQSDAATDGLLESLDWFVVGMGVLYMVQAGIWKRTFLQSPFASTYPHLEEGRKRGKNRQLRTRGVS